MIAPDGSGGKRLRRGKWPVIAHENEAARHGCPWLRHSCDICNGWNHGFVRRIIIRP
jgi:hypothetical protein